MRKPTSTVLRGGGDGNITPLTRPWKKGHRYGTILLNLERQCLVDLLPDREKATVAAWLKSHPGVKMVSRETGVVHMQKRREKRLLDAIQIADRFHLSQNTGEIVVRIMRRSYDRVKKSS